MRRVVRIDFFNVDMTAGQLSKRAKMIRLRNQPFNVFGLLLAHPGQVVTSDESRRQLWPDEVFVDFNNCVNMTIARLHTVLGDSAKHPRFIETLPRRGYRFIGPVTVVSIGAQRASQNP